MQTSGSRSIGRLARSCRSLSDRMAPRFDPFNRRPHRAGVPNHGHSAKARKKRDYHEKVQPPDIHDRISWKMEEIQDARRKQEAAPGDPVWPLVVARLKDELGALQALRDGKTWRRNG